MEITISYQVDKWPVRDMVRKCKGVIRSMRGGVIMKKRPFVWCLLGIMTVGAAVLTFNPKLRDTTVLMAVIYYTEWTRPNDEITQAIRNGSSEWGDNVALSPKPFALGSPQENVIDRLKRAKYQVDPEQTFSISKPHTLPKGSLYYRMEDSEGPCDMHYGVALVFDETRHLREAWGARDETGCL